MGERTDEGLTSDVMNDDVPNDFVVLAFYNDVLNIEDAKLMFEEEYPHQSHLYVSKIIKQVHYKNNDD